MKKIYNYVLAVAAIVTVFTACRPLDKVNEQIGPAPKAVVPTPTTASLTLGASEYGLLPSTNEAQTNQFFRTDNDAANSIPAILASKYPTVIDKSTVTVTYAMTPTIPGYFRAADSVYTHVAYTLTTADYVLAGKTYSNFSAAQILQWLAAKYPVGTAVANQLAVLTFAYYENGTANTVQQSFIFQNGAWKKIYTISAAQYQSIGKGGTNNDLASADMANAEGYFNTLLQQDPAVASTAKYGDIQLVSYKYYGGSTANTFQRVYTLVYDGKNWVGTNKTNTVTFVKTNGTWAVQTDTSTRYTLTAGDYTTIGNIANVASADAIANLKSHGNFSLNGTARWTDAQIAAGVAAILKANYPAPTEGQVFNATVATYGGYTTMVFQFIYTGGNFVYQPTPDKSKYTLTGDDYDNISKIPNIAPSAATTNLQSFGDFSTSGASIWTDAQINAGIAATLKARYPNATTNQQILVSYAIYSGGNKVVTRTFKYDGSAWIAQ